jgi:sarcosine oxidase subunit alpha
MLHPIMGPRNVTFYLDDKPLTGVEGEPIARALFRAGVRTLSYSVKYKRPRSLFCARGRCVMCHMEVNGTPGVPTCITPLEEGMRVRRERFGPVFAPALVVAARLFPLPAGFYYRMFTRPRILREAFLGTLRRMAGVGRVPIHAKSNPGDGPEPKPSLHIKARYDTVVVGAGLSGLAAALAAAKRGEGVLLVDEYADAGGHSLGFHADAELMKHRDQMIVDVENHASITHITRTTAQGFYPPDTILLGPGGSVPDTGAAADRSPRLSGLRRVRASTFVFATGGYDIVPLFRNNDTPGIFGARAIRLLLERDQLIPGRNAVVYGHGQPLEELTALLRHHGISVAAAVDAGNTNGIAGTTHLRESCVTEARGGEWISSVTVARRRADGPQETVACDLLCTAFAPQGAYELAYQAGFRFAFSSGDVPEDRVMVPSAEELSSEGGVTYRVVGELAGRQYWREKLGTDPVGSGPARPYQA